MAGTNPATISQEMSRSVHEFAGSHSALQIPFSLGVLGGNSTTEADTNASGHVPLPCRIAPPLGA